MKLTSTISDYDPKWKDMFEDRPMNLLGTLLLIGILIVLSGCGPKLDITPGEVEQKINATLKVGDDSDKIEAFFVKEGMTATFDKYSNRYGSTIRHPDSNHHAISVYIYVDASRQFLRAEAKDSYTMP